MPDESIAVLAPSVYVSITIEADAGEVDDIHIHAGGQGIWIARMILQLGHHATVCAPVGGEAGETLRGLTAEWGIQVDPVATVEPTPAYVHDRRDGDRVEIARSPLPTMHRHEADEIHNRFLELALRAGTCVVTGPEGSGQIPDEVYTRLGTDLAAADVRVVADLHGTALAAFLAGGPVEVLKVSLGDLVEDGALDDEYDDAALADVIDDLRGRAVGTVVVSRGDRPAVAGTPDGYRTVSGPELAVVDSAGSGDSMSAALAVCQVERLDADTSLARAWAAGATNVTRHGLGSGIRELVEQLTERANVEEWKRP